MQQALVGSPAGVCFGVCAASQTVTHNVTVVNTGNVQLRNVLPTTTLTAGGQHPTIPAYSCGFQGGAAALALPAGGFAIVPKPGALVCTATYEFATVQTIEAGNLAFATQVAVAGATSKSGTARTVTVHSLPQLNVSADAATCAEPSPNDASEWGTLHCLL